MPEAHQRVTEKITPEKLLRWAQSIGGSVVTVIEAILKSRRHPEQAYRTCIGILRLEQKYSKEALERTCKIAHEYNLLSYRQIKNLLHNGAYIRDDKDREIRHTATHEHENLRGSGYYN